MANQPKISLHQISSRIDIVDFAKIRQEVNATNGEVNIAEYVREALHQYVAGVTLTSESEEYIKNYTEHVMNIRNEQKAKSESRRPKHGIFSRLFRRK